jgi:hypothetical protein
MRCELLCLVNARAAPHLLVGRFSMSDKPKIRGTSMLFDLALTFGAGAFIFLSFSGFLHAYAP